MSLIVDLEEADARRLFPPPAPRREIEFNTVRYRRWVARRDRRLWIERDTPIVPGVLADDVCGEISRWLGVELPRSWRVRLAVRADVIYYHNRQFRQGVRRRGRGGVDYLRMFMRHWLAAMLYRRRPEWYERVPASYASGADLPESGRETRRADDRLDFPQRRQVPAEPAKSLPAVRANGQRRHDAGFQVGEAPVVVETTISEKGSRPD